MSWTSPMTAVAGSIYTAAQYNTYTRDNDLHLYAAPQNRCSAYHDTTQTVNAGAAAVLSLNQESYDTASMHDPASNNSRITIPAGGGGGYLFWGWAPRDGATGLILFSIRKNGTNVYTVNSGVSGVAEDMCHIAGYLNGLAAGDYLELYADPQSNNTVFGNATTARSTRLTVIGPLPAS